MAKGQRYVHVRNGNLLEAKAASSVKITGKDVVSTWKIMVALFLFPSFYWVYTMIYAYYAFYYWQLPLRTVISHSVSLILFVLPAMAYATMLATSKGLTIIRSLNPLIVSMSNKDPKKLLRLRNQLQKKVIAITEELGPKIFPNFANHRLVKPKHFEDWERIELDDISEDEHHPFLNSSPVSTRVE
jgi:glycerol-3-phosphate O-acyltransferase/dihydroxyacetone phosphate acyltransferase